MLLSTQLAPLSLIAPVNANMNAPSKQQAKIESAAQDFEAVFISEMLKPMMESVEVDDMFGGGKGEEIFRGIMIQELGKSIAKQGGFGLSAQVKNHLLHLQEQQTSQTSSGEAA